MKEFVMLLKGNLDKLKEDLTSIAVMAKLPSTSQTAISVTFLVINLSTLLRQVLCLFLCFFRERTNFLLFSPLCY
jgi:hypothetical protein